MRTAEPIYEFETCQKGRAGVSCHVRAVNYYRARGAGAYNPKEKVTVNGQKITLAQYASRMNIKLLRPADFNSK